MFKRLVFRIMLTILLMNVLVLTIKVLPLKAESYYYNFKITVTPESPTTSDEITVTVSLDIANINQNVTFGQVSQVGNEFLVDVDIHVPQIVLPMIRYVNHTYNLGKLPAGSYSFKAVVTVSGYGSGFERYNKSFTVIVGHDIAITNMWSKTIVGQGHPAYINVVVKDEGFFTETFNVTVYTQPTLQVGNPTLIETQNTTLTPGTISTITFTWNTTSVAKRNYTLVAHAGPVLDENDTDDNSYAFGEVRITIFGDLNGDLKVDILDVTIAARAWGSKPGAPSWNPNADLDDNGMINIIDLSKVFKQFGKRDP